MQAEHGLHDGIYFSYSSTVIHTTKVSIARKYQTSVGPLRPIITAGSSVFRKCIRSRRKHVMTLKSKASKETQTTDEAFLIKLLNRIAKPHRLDYVTDPERVRLSRVVSKVVGRPRPSAEGAAWLSYLFA